MGGSDVQWSCETTCLFRRGALPSEGLPTLFELLPDMLLAVGVLDYDGSVWSHTHEVSVRHAKTTSTASQQKGWTMMSAKEKSSRGTLSC